jgi:lysophospholipase L1-like esterase
VNPLLLPIVAVQGRWVRSTLKMAAPAAGPTSGNVGDASRPPVRIAVVGDSTAAGHGVDTHDDGFPGCLARELAARTRRPVMWEAVGQFGATARRIRYRLLPRLGENLNVAVLLAGANDVLTRRPPEHWGDDLAAIVDDLADRAEHVVVSGIPPFHVFPSLPTTLGRYLAERASALDEVSQQVCAEQPRATWIGFADTVSLSPDFFSHDRFHPAAPGYRRWAQAVADHLTL